MLYVLQIIFFVVSFSLLTALPESAQADFSDAQVAASEGRYRDVIDILSQELLTSELTPEQVVVAYANRGIAYSLLKAYALARQDLNQALALNPDHALTLNHLGLLHEQVDEDYAAAASYYERAVAFGFPASQVNLANLYRQGLGVKKNPHRAFELYRAAAKANYGLAFVPLANLYSSGEAGEQDQKKAFQLYQQAAASGVASANYYLGIAYEKARGVKQNLELAVRHYQIAAVQGHGQAQNALGYLYRRGHGVEQDFLEAATWYQLAADQGVPGAMNRLAWLLAGCPIEKVCNGDAAIELALNAIEIGDTASRRDSLAAGYARSGQFDKAIATLEATIAGLPADSRQRSTMQRRLENYRKGIPLQL